jgi:hypothetical protein
METQDNGALPRARCPHSCGCGNQSGVEIHREMTKGALRTHKAKANLHRDCSVGCPGFGLLGVHRFSFAAVVAPNAEAEEEDEEDEQEEDDEGEEARTKSGHPLVRCPHSCGCGN